MILSKNSIFLKIFKLFFISLLFISVSFAVYSISIQKKMLISSLENEVKNINKLKGDLMYFIKEFIEFFFPKIDENIQIEGLSFLSTKEKEYFLEMGKYDRYHSLEVYKKMKNTFLKYDAIFSA